MRGDGENMTAEEMKIKGLEMRIKQLEEKFEYLDKINASIVRALQDNGILD